MKDKKTILQFLKFTLVSSLVTIIQLVSLNLLCVWMKNLTTPLPALLATVFNERTVGQGNANWGYILPFFLSNVLANTFGYYQNRKRTFHSNAPKRNFIIYLVILAVLICLSTLYQSAVASRLAHSSITLLQKGAVTIAGFTAGLIQFAILFPLEKYVLLKEVSAN